MICSLFVSCGMAKKSDAYKEAIAFLKQHAQAVDLLGDISDDTSVYSFNLQTAPAAAEFTMTVHGTKQAGQYVVKLNKDTGVWKPVVATLSTDNNVTLNLMSVVSAPKALAVTRDYFGTEKWGTEVSPPVFALGKTVFYHMEAEGVKQREDGKAVIEADMVVENEAGEVVLNQEKIITGDGDLTNGILALSFSLDSNEAVPTGTYNMKINLRDMLNGKQLTSARKFEFIKGQ